jgi:CRP-like cAMP-binding protein
MQKHLEKLTQLYEELVNIAGEDFHNIFHKVKLKKGKFLLKEGNICQHTWIIESGIARVFKTKNEIEIVTYFAFPGEFIDSYKSFVLQVPSRENVQLIEDSVVSVISRKDIELLASKYPLVNEIDKHISEIYAIWLEDRIYSLQFSTAKERYDELLNKYPHYIQRIPLTYIASYLGVTLETLSRIRAKKE